MTNKLPLRPPRPPASFFNGGHTDYPTTELVRGMITVVTTPGNSAYFVDPNLQTKSHGIQPYKPVAIGDYEEDTSIVPTPYPGATAGSARDAKFDGGSSEIAAAFLVGVSPSNKNGSGQNSGGVHNLPRFLERWTGTAAIRGSIVVMYESRVADEPWGLRFYGPPTRLWGFNTLFGTDQRYPPQMPLVMSYRRVDFTDLTKAQYDALKAALPSGSGSTGAIQITPPGP